MGRRPKSGRLRSKLCHHTTFTYTRADAGAVNTIPCTASPLATWAMRSVLRAGSSRTTASSPVPSGRRSDMSPAAVCRDLVHCRHTRSAPASGAMTTMSSRGPAVRLSWQRLTSPGPRCPFAIPNPAKSRESNIGPDRGPESLANHPARERGDGTKRQRLRAVGQLDQPEGQPATKITALVQGYSGHSTHVSMAQDLNAAGAELPELIIAAWWDSPTMPIRCTEVQTAAGRCRPILPGRLRK